MQKETSAGKTIWGAVCEACLTSFSAWPHWENPSAIPEPQDWEHSTTCPICGNKLTWDFSDPIATFIHTGYTEEEIS